MFGYEYAWMHRHDTSYIASFPVAASPHRPAHDAFTSATDALHRYIDGNIAFIESHRMEMKALMGATGYSPQRGYAPPTSVKLTQPDQARPDQAGCIRTPRVVRYLAGEAGIRQFSHRRIGAY